MLSENVLKQRSWNVLITLFVLDECSHSVEKNVLRIHSQTVLITLFLFVRLTVSIMLLFS